MPLDGLVLSGLIYECQEKLAGGRISKIYQPFADEIHLLIYNNGHNYRLLISASANNSRIHLTETVKKNPTKPPMFCMLLRKHLEGGRINSIRQQEFERIVRVEVQSKDELGNPVEKMLLIEIMGRHSNIMLVNKSDNKVIDAALRVPFGMSQYRQVLPGMQYQQPPSFGKMSPLSQHSDIEDSEVKDSNYLVNNFQGISPLLARELLHRTNSIGSALKLLRKIVHNNLYEPSICRDMKTGRKQFGAITLTHLSGTNERFSSVNQMCDAFYINKEQDALTQSLRRKLRKTISDNLSRAQRTLEKQEKAWEKAQLADQYKRMADLIKANIYQIKEGQSTARVIDYYDETMPMISLELNPNKSPQQNLTDYYKKYEKAKRSQETISSRMAKTRKEVDYLEALKWSLDNSELHSDYSEIESELINEGYLAELNTQSHGVQKDLVQKPREFVSSQGFEILVGRNNRQNDYLTMRIAKKEDLWLHTKDIAGSHVIIKNQSGNIPSRTIEEAAMLAAYFSKGRRSGNVPVDCTKVRYVHKPKGAKPGMVTYEQHRTVYVTPEENIVSKLEKK